MKKTTLGVAILSIASIAATLSTSVYADGGITDYDGLAACLGFNAGSEIVCNVDGDIAITNNITVTRKVTLNLNGHTISVKNPGFTGSTGKGMITVEHGGDLTVNGAGTITTEGSDVCAAIRMTGDTNNTQKAKFTLNNATLVGHYYAITGNGSEGRDNTEIIINSGTVKGTNTDQYSNLGIFHPQAGTMIINGGTISGHTGIEMRAGTLIVNGGVIESVVDENYANSIVSNASGSTSDGYALAVAQHSTKLPISVTINAGTIKGLRSFVESNPEQNPTEAINKISLSVKGGTFTGTVESEDVEHFVTAGTFKAGLADELIAEGSYIKDGVVQKETTAAEWEEKEQGTIKSPNTGAFTSESSANSNGILAAIATGLTVTTFGIVLVLKRKLK